MSEEQAAAPNPEPAPAEPIANPPAVVKVGKKNFTAVYLAATKEEKQKGIPGRVVEFSDQEASVLNSFLKTHDYCETAKEVGIQAESVKRILRRPNLKRYINEIIAKVAAEEGTDKPWATKELRRVWEGEVIPTAIQMDAMKLIAKFVEPKGVGVMINNQQSFYGAMPKETVDVEWADARATDAKGI